MIAAGADLDRLARDLEISEGIPPDTTYHYHRREAKARDAAAKRERDVEIMRSVARGWTNAQLAERFGVCERTIGRIVAKQLRRNES